MILKIFALVFTMFAFAGFSLFSQTAPTDTSTITSFVKVKGLTCAMDAERISENVKHLDGVKACKIDKFGTTTRFEITVFPKCG
ncbi:MAG: heavy-metal-associated domain-containing protein [Bacteroidales bacterium]|nr:heavy-metal-associated domain-containing protein [Bacteroidales bacterium]